MPVTIAVVVVVVVVVVVEVLGESRRLSGTAHTVVETIPLGDSFGIGTRLNLGCRRYSIF